MTDVPHRILDLIETFDRNIEAYHSPQYYETQLRLEFIDPFFEELGWDVTNKSGCAPQYRDVIHEDAISVSGATKAPDYCFRIGGVRKFFLEAKKPSINIKGDPHPAYQLRRYAWSAKLPLSILTDFEEFAVYDCQTRPKHTDSAATARIMFFNYKQYPEKWHEIADIFGKDAIWKGSFDKFAVSEKGKRGTTTVDTEFLAEIEGWRKMLAQIIALRNRSLSTREVNFAVQQTIDRILFLRMCEDRGIEPPDQLRALTSGDRAYPRLCEIFERADQKYNSGLFHFEDEPNREPPDKLTLNLIIDDVTLKWILRSLYYPQSPYEFSVLPAEILGNVYEQFLGKIIRLTPARQAKIEEKPEVKKAGGVYYTPSYIVDYIVKNTVGKLTGDPTAGHCESAEGGRGNLTNEPSVCHCEEAEGRRGNLTNDPSCHSERSEESRSSIVNRNLSAIRVAESKFGNQKPLTPKQIANLKILDPACGSGSFLLGAYTYLLNYHRDWYAANDPQKHTKQIYQGRAGDWFLTITEKKRILLNNIFGVDIDPQAVEVTKLSLLLKVLEGENSQTLENQYRLFHERALPDLATNIKCGNSLIGHDFFDNLEPEPRTTSKTRCGGNNELRTMNNEQRTILDDLRQKINAFDYHTEFPQIFSRKNAGFDAVIGNPPYLKEKNNKETFAQIRQSKNKEYCMGKMDLWYAFACVALDLLRSGGLHSFIGTNNWITNYGARILRAKIMSEARILKFVDFADFRVFSEASIQTMIYTIHKEHISSQYRIPYLKIPTSLTDENHIIRAINTDSFWGTSTIDPARKGEPFTLSKLEISSVLDKIQKIQSRHFSSSDIGNGIDVLQDFVGKNHLEKLKDKSVKPGDGVFVLSNNEKRSVALTDTDSQKIKPYFTTSEISRYLALQPNRYWIIYSDKGVRDNIQSYPGIKKHLNKFKSIITSAYRPYGLHRPRDEHFFNGPKILSIRKTRKPCFSFVEFPCYVSRAFLILKPNEWPESFNYLLGLLNSKVAAFWLYYRGKKQGDQLQIDKEPLQNIPIRTIDFDNPDDKVMHDKMVNLVEQMLDLHKQLAAARIPDEKTRIQREISATDSQIDQLVYSLYGLTDEEIKIVEEREKQ